MRWILVGVVLAACGRGKHERILTRWDGQELTCENGTLTLRDVTATAPVGAKGYAIFAEGTCRLVIERSVLHGVSIGARGHAIVELRDVQIDGSIGTNENARATLASVRPTTDAGDLTAYADGDSAIAIAKSHLRGHRAVGGNVHGVVDVVDSKIEGRETDGSQLAVYTWGAARVNVHGGEMVGLGQGQGQLDLQPATWTSPTLDASKTLSYVRCLATMDVQIRSALAEVADRGAPMISADRVRPCADDVAAFAAMKPRKPERDDAAATWAAQLAPIAAKLEQLRRYVDAGDDKDDGGARGKQLREQLASAGAALEAASIAFAEKSARDRVSAYAWLRSHAGTLEGAVIELFIAVEELGLTARPLEPTAVATALDTANTASTALFDLVTDRTVTDPVTSFWAPESGNATTWNALEAALRAVHDEIKRVRRELKDAQKPVGLAQLARIGELFAVAHGEYSRLKFPARVESSVP